MKAGEMTLLNGSGATTSSLPLSFSCTNIHVLQDYYSYYIIYNYYKILFKSKIQRSIIYPHVAYNLPFPDICMRAIQQWASYKKDLL